ncbi:MAG: CRISPR-associated endonuclease Cas1 [Peptoanaerobacter stomatis]
MSHLYIQKQGSTLGFQKNRFVINAPQENETYVPLENIQNITLFGNIQVTAHCIHNILSHEINLTFLSKNGEYIGRLESSKNININKQRLQFQKSEDQKFKLEMSKKFIQGKIQNQKTVLQRLNRKLTNDKLAKTIKDIQLIIKKIDNVQETDKLMGLEGYTAKLYYKAISDILPQEYKFDKRTKRPPKDPFNAMISFGYTLLHNQIYSIISAKGLNPYVAFLHSDRQNHPALCSDIIEEFRAALIDTLSIHLINNQKITIDDFEYTKNAVYLKKDANKKFIEELEKRLNQEVSYIADIPYKMNFKQIIEHQINLIIKSMNYNDTTLYKPMTIR